MRARSLDAPPEGGARFGVENGLVGIGERLIHPPADLADAVLESALAHGAKAGRMLAAFASLPAGTLIWTRVGDVEYRLGQITGPWRYLDTVAARAVGIHHVRDATWAGPTFTARTAPAAVVRTFGRGGRNFQRIHDRAAEIETVAVWRRDGSAAAA